MDNFNNNELVSEFGKNVRRIRKQVGMTQEQLAKKCGYSLKAIGDIELCKSDPKLSTAANIADALNINIAQLLDNRVAIIEDLNNLGSAKVADYISDLRLITKYRKKI